MQITENQGKSPKINENHRKSMKITENDRKSPKMTENDQNPKIAVSTIWTLTKHTTKKIINSNRSSDHNFDIFGKLWTSAFRIYA